jgi:hypothetical protein
MPRCRWCREPLAGARETLGARCPYCREPLYEWHAGSDGGARAASGEDEGGRCAAHPRNRAVGTCQRCGNYLCAVCWTRWRNRSLCLACLERALEAKDAAPEEVRAHLRQAVLAVLCGLAAWGLALIAALLVGLGLAAGFEGEPEQGLLILGGLLLLASPLPAVLGVGQGAAAVRARGDHLILATAGLLLSGMHLGVLIGLFTFAAWHN